MKKILLLFIVFLGGQNLFGQGVGINTTTPDQSAALDIRSPSGSEKGVSLPNVYLQSLTDNTTIPNAKPGLLIWNTNQSLPAGAGLYQCSGLVAGILTWKNISDQFELPLAKSVTTNTVGLDIANFGGVSSSTAIRGHHGGSGIGVRASSVSGLGLDVSGGVKIAGNGQSPGVGKVLTSDANGNATWEGAVAFSAFTSAAVAQVPYNTAKKIPFDSENYDLGNNFDNVNSIFTAPVTGIYHFDVQVSYEGDSDNPNEDYSSTLILTGDQAYRNIHAVKSPDFARKVHTISCDVKLVQGNQVLLTYFHSLEGGVTHISHANPDGVFTYFNGRLVTKL